MSEENIRNLDKVWEENKRLKECIEILIKLIEECKLENKLENKQKDQEE